MRWFALLGLALVLSGCAAEDAPDAPATIQQAEEAAQNLEVEATDTTGVIRGFVVDETLTPLAGALVTLQGGRNTTTTEKGAFGFDDLEPGTYFLTAALKGYTQVQQSADVVAGIDSPDAIRVLLTRIPMATPFVESLSANVFLTWSGWVDGVGGVTVSSLTGEGLYFFNVDITPNGTLAQTEMVWAPTSPLGEISLAGGGTYNDDGGLDTDDWTGPSPLIMVANATTDDGTADRVGYSVYAFAGDLPVGMHLNQRLDVVVNVFHNFLPNPGWTFVGDGPHPVPEP